MYTQITIAHCTLKNSNNQLLKVKGSHRKKILQSQQAICLKCWWQIL